MVGKDSSVLKASTVEANLVQNKRGTSERACFHHRLVVIHR